METLIKMINVFAWIAVTVIPTCVFLQVHWQWQHEYSEKESLARTLDRLRQVKTNYMKHTFKFLLVFLIALVYLIVK